MVTLADAWEENARDWMAWARAPMHDGFWDGTWPALRELLPEPDGPVLDLGCSEGRAGWLATNTLLQPDAPLARCADDGPPGAALLDIAPGPGAPEMPHRNARACSPAPAPALGRAGQKGGRQRLCAAAGPAAFS